jgi:hypothetical protein
MPTPTSTPPRCEPAHCLEPAGRRRSAGLGRPPNLLVERRDREEHLRTSPSSRLLQEVDVAHDERAAGDDRERRPRRVQLDETCPREPEPAFGGLIRIRRGSECHLFSPPRLACELASEHVGDVRLHADRTPVAVVRRPVGALLEVAHVTERAAVCTAHVRVQRPLERHAPNLRERRFARLDSILDPHRSRIEHMFDHGKGDSL